ncbi:hypothetical protein CVT26_012846, partial [Gymnopilus dilepis]
MGGETPGNLLRYKSRSTLEDEPDDSLHHKRPLNSTSEDDGPPIVCADPNFDFGRLLEDLSLNPSPQPSPLGLQPAELFFDDKPSTSFSHSSASSHPSSTTAEDLEFASQLFSLSPLTSPTPSPPASPITRLKNLSNHPELEHSDQLSDLNGVDADKNPPRSPGHTTNNPPSSPSLLSTLLPLSTKPGALSNKSGGVDADNNPPSPPGHINITLPSSPSLLTTHLPLSTGLAALSNESGVVNDGNNVASSELTHSSIRRTSNHQRRKEKRQSERLQSFSHYEPRSNPKKELAPPIRVDLATEKCSAAATAFVGLNDGTRGKKLFKLHELVGEHSKYKFGYVEWNGQIRRSVADTQGRQVAFLAGQPNDKEWPQLMQCAADALESSRPRLLISRGERVHRRGAFPAVRCGISHGGGSKYPGNLRNNAENAAVVDELSHMACFKRLSGFATSVMASKAPKLYQYYIEHLAELHKNHPELKRLFPCSVFAAASYNFGPRTACYKHKDFANLPFGLCAVTALGNFNPRLGGHLVLWECKLVIEFPPGATILLPSAVVAHSNTPIQDNERRYSFAQYTAGGIFRWVENDCKLADDYYASLSPEDLEAALKR